MTAKEYLSQARQIDVRINSKMEQVSSLRDMATKATQTLADMPFLLYIIAVGNPGGLFIRSNVINMFEKTCRLSEN